MSDELTREQTDIFVTTSDLGTVMRVGLNTRTFLAGSSFVMARDYTIISDDLERMTDAAEVMRKDNAAQRTRLDEQTARAEKAEQFALDIDNGRWRRMKVAENAEDASLKKLSDTRTIYEKSLSDLTSKLAQVTQERGAAMKQMALQKEVADNQTWHVQDLRRQLTASEQRVEEIQKHRHDYAVQLDSKELDDPKYMQAYCSNFHADIGMEIKRSTALAQQSADLTVQLEVAQAEIERLITEPRAIQLLNANHRLEEELSKARNQLAQLQATVAAQGEGKGCS